MSNDEESKRIESFGEFLEGNSGKEKENNENDAEPNAPERS